jgi:hypothetical protein
MTDYADEDVGNIISLEHINVQIPDQAVATLFYVVGMGFTRDPYLNVGLNNMWVNVGEQQFHLPTRPPQVIDGHVGMVLPDLQLLKTRLESVATGLKDTGFEYSVQPDHVAVTSPWGNRYRCYESDPAASDLSIGIPYVEFNVSPGSVPGILRFYRTVLGAPVVGDSNGGGAVGRVKIGRQQSLIFRETERPLAPYDGHHIAIYVANFSGPYGYLNERGLISEDVRNHQFRFKDIIDPEDGKKKLSLEHEVRSMKHPMYSRPFVNRDAAQTQRAYRRGWDALTPFQR